jgi:hypothetical protein
MYDFPIPEVSNMSYYDDQKRMVATIESAVLRPDGAKIDSLIMEVKRQFGYGGLAVKKHLALMFSLGLIEMDNECAYPRVGIQKTKRKPLPRKAKCKSKR